MSVKNKLPEHILNFATEAVKEYIANTNYSDCEMDIDYTEYMFRAYKGGDCRVVFCDFYNELCYIVYLELEDVEVYTADVMCLRY